MKLPVGLQLYGLRDILEERPGDFLGTMKKIKAMGFDGVELAGLYGLPASKIKSALKEADLIPFSAHVPLVDLLADIRSVADTYSEIGCQYIAVPYLPENCRPNTAGYNQTIADIAAIGAALKKRKLQLVYHNHDFEFVKLPNGTYGLDDIYARIPSEYLMAEPDTCWIKCANVDPVSFINQYSGRCPVVHLKDFIKEGNPHNLYKLIGLDEEEKQDDTGIFEFRPVGFGQQIWEPILEASVNCGAKWIVIEQDEHYQLSSLEAARCSREYLKILGY